MWLLPERDDHGCGRAPEGEAETHRCRHRCYHHQYLPLRYLPASARGNSRRGDRLKREDAMNYAPQMNRRSFVIGTAAVGGGLALGLELPFSPRGARAAVGGPDVHAWVV